LILFVLTLNVQAFISEQNQFPLLKAISGDVEIVNAHGDLENFIDLKVSKYNFINKKSEDINLVVQLVHSNGEQVEFSALFVKELDGTFKAQVVFDDLDATMYMTYLLDGSKHTINFELISKGDFETLELGSLSTVLEMVNLSDLGHNQNHFIQ